MTTKMFSKWRKAADKARKLAIEHKNCFPFTLCFRNHINMVEQQNSSSKVQALYELCKKTFTPSGVPPPSHASQKLCSLLDTVGPADVGLKEENQDDRGHGFLGLNRLSSVARWAQPITYVDIYECDSFTMKAYDWVEPACYLKSKGPGYPAVRLAKLTVDKTLTAPCGTSVLYPKSGGNLHCFTAVTPCAMLDILTPPYREEAGRKCTYYHDYPYSTFSIENGAEIGDEKVDDHAWLAEIETPDDLYMRPGAYTGPAVQV